jgi:nicotinamide mononucleotide adenylyltransferase
MNMLKKVRVSKLPNCDMCGKTARYDCPIDSGSWGNLCEECFKDYGTNTIGSELVFENKVSNFKPSESNVAIERTNEDYWSEVMFEGMREVTCPKCGEIHHMEPDARDDFKCHSCNVTLSMPEGIY